MLIVTNNVLNLAVLNDAKEVGNSLDALKVHLVKGDITPTPGVPLATYTAAEADYTGYATEDVTWLDPVINDAGQVELIGTVPEFRPTASTVGNSIYGLFVTDTAGAVLKFAGRFDNPPLPMNGVTDNILVTLRFVAPSAGSVNVVT